MKQKHQKILMRFLLPVLLFPLPIAAQENVSINLAKYMQAQEDVNNFSGTVLVTRNDTILLKSAYGLADYEWNIRSTINTKYSLASVSKQFTAAAILQLIDSKQLLLESKLTNFFSNFPDGDRITIHMMLCHMSGLQMDFDELYLNHVSITQDSVLKYLEQKKLLFVPGTATAYSNIGYYLLARIIEKVTNLSYADYLRANIFDKCEMKNSGVITNDELVISKASNYLRDGNKFINNPYINWEYNIGHDGIYATAEDLYLWNKALYGTSVLSEAMKKLMFTTYNEQQWGYGWVINPFYNHGHQLIAHDGGFFGAMTSLNRFIDDNVFITVLSNNQSASHLIAYGLSAIVFDKDVELPYKHQQIVIDKSKLYNYVGKYGNDIEIIVINEILYYNNVSIELLPESNTKFFRKDNNDKTIEFIADKTGAYNSIIITKGGVKEKIQRSVTKKTF